MDDRPCGASRWTELGLQAASLASSTGPSVLVGPEDVARGAGVADRPCRLEVAERQRDGAVGVETFDVVDRPRPSLDGDEAAVGAATEVPLGTRVRDGLWRMQQLEERHGPASLASARGGEQAHHKYTGHER